jgi:hypothetical protein
VRPPKRLYRAFDTPQHSARPGSPNSPLQRSASNRFTQAHSAETETSLRTGSVPSKRTQRKTPNLRSTLPR